jgi:TetR/AcrR family transcriptional repressor of mexJK operon
MPRALGQIDLKKSEAIVDAAQAVFADRGYGAASIDEIARRAGVSKQTIYNQFGAKEDLFRSLVERSRHNLTAALDEPGAEERLEETLTAYATSLLLKCQDRELANVLRIGIAAAAEHPQSARILYEAGIHAARDRFARFLEAESRAGRLEIDDAYEAAEFFSGMAAGHKRLKSLLGMPPDLDAEGIKRRARSCAQRFLRAYAV